MKLIAIVWLFLGLSPLRAQFPAGDLITVESSSKQFVVRGPRPGRLAYLPIDQVAGKTVLKLDPATAAASCERIRNALLKELGFIDQRSKLSRAAPAQGGRIFLNIKPGLNSGIVISPFATSRGWNYRMELPSEMEPRKFIETVVDVLVVGLAIQGSDNSAIELPRWFTDGLVGHLQSTSLQDLVLEPQTSGNLERMTFDVTATSRERLRNLPALTFEELSWPQTVQGLKAEAFADCAQLLFYELLRLPNGPACFQKMIAELPRNKNWQFAFLAGFHSHFAQLVDVEKWWALRLVAFTGRDPARLWSSSDTLHSLDESVEISAKARYAPNLLPQATGVTLQQIIARWDYPRQKLALQQVIKELRALRLHSAPEVVALVDEYRIVLENYLQRHDRLGFTPLRKGEVPDSAVVLKRSAGKTLDRLDQLRLGLHQQLASSARAPRL